MRHWGTIIIVVMLLAGSVSVFGQRQRDQEEEEPEKVLAVLPAYVKYVKVETKAPENSYVSVYYRIPKNYNPKSQTLYRVLVIFGGRNFTGKMDASGAMGWGPWADENDVFIVSPGFKNDSYWEPKVWSGKALIEALAEIKKKYRICDTKLLYYGYSAGSQCSNLFPAWKPEITRAWVSHACGVFHEPSQKMRGVPGLVTCGDVDMQRYMISRKFVEDSRKKDVNIIWKSFPNHPHDVPPESQKLARAFLSYYHNLYFDDLKGAGGARVANEKPVFIGDDVEQVYYSAKAPAVKEIPKEERVYLPSEEIAEAWGKPGKREK